MDMDELTLMEEQMTRHWEMVRQETIYRSERELRTSIASAMQSVCLAMAQSGAMGAVMIKDPKEAAQSFGDSIRWQMAGILAATGNPETTLRFLKQDTMTGGSGEG